MAEDFGDSTGSGLVNTAGQAAKEVVQAVVTKGAGIGGKGGGGISLSGEAKDMMAASKQADPEEDEKVQKQKEEARQRQMEKSTEYYKSHTAKPGSIAAKARMVEQYNEKTGKKK